MTMMPIPPAPIKEVQYRTIGDLERALKSLATHFEEDVFVVVGSQAILVGWPAAPAETRNTSEIDIYLANWAKWDEGRQEGDTSDWEIDGLFGQASEFYNKYGFFVDGVSRKTAALPEGWEKRAVFREIKHNDKTVTGIAPCVEDLIVAKMARLEEKDRIFIEACANTRGLDVELICAGIKTAPYENDYLKKRALNYINGLEIKPLAKIERVPAPDYPQDGTHQAFWSQNGLTVTIRELDPATGLYYKISNPVGPAIRQGSAEGYAIHGVKMSETRWAEHPDVANYGRNEHLGQATRI